MNVPSPVIFLAQTLESLFRQLPPCADVSPRHPLFKVELQRVRYFLDGYELFHASFRVARIVFIALFFLWLVAATSDANKSYSYATGVSTVIPLLFAVSILIDGFLDFACMVASVNGFSGEVIAGRWDLLRMTPLKAEEIIAVKHAAARIRVWRMTNVVFAIRLSWALLGLMTWWLNFGNRGEHLRLEHLFFYFTVLFVVMVYLMEPFWRAEVVTAIGLIISSRVRNGLSLSLSAIGAVMAFWIFQIVVIGSIFWCSGSLFAPFFSPVAQIDNGFLILFLICFYIAVVLYGFYATVKKFALNNLIRSIQRVD